MNTNLPLKQKSVLDEDRPHLWHHVITGLDVLMKSDTNQNNHIIRKLSDKLEYLKFELARIARGNASSDSDLGYSSQCDLEPEKTLLRTIEKQMNRLKDDNKKLCIEVNNATFTCKAESQIIKAKNKVINSIANHLSNVFGKEISAGTILNDKILPVSDQEKKQQKLKKSTSKSKCGFCPESTPFCEPIIKIQEVLNEKNSKIEKLKVMEIDMKNDKKSMLMERAAKDKIIENLQLKCSEEKTVVEKMSSDLTMFYENKIECNIIIDTLCKENEQLKSDLIALNREYFYLEEEYNKINVNQQKLKCNIAVLENNVNKMKSMCTDSHNKLSFYQEQFRIIKLKCKCGEVKELLRIKSNGMDEYERLAELLKAKDNELKQLQQNAANDKNKIFILQEKNKRLQTKIDELNDILIQNQLELDKITGQTKKLCESKSSEDVIKKLKSDLETKKEMHKEQIKKFKSNLSTLRQHMINQNDALTKQKEDFKQCEEEIISYLENCDKIYIEKYALQNELFNLEELFNRSKFSEQCLKEKNSALELALSNTKIDLHKKSDTLKDSYVDIVQKYNILVDDYNSLQLSEFF